MRRLIIALAALLSGCSPGLSTETADASAGVETQFDLNCRGTRYLRSEATPFEQVIHVDLEAGRYCTGECADSHRINSRHPGMIVFRDRPSDGYNLVDKASWFPETGQYVAEFAATYRAYYETRTLAVCTRSELSAAVPGEPVTGDPDVSGPNLRDGLHSSQPG